MSRERGINRLFMQRPELLFQGQSHDIVGRFSCVQSNGNKRLNIAFLNKMRVIEEWSMIPNDKGELVPDINTPYQAIVDNDPSVIDWFNRANHGDVIEGDYEVQLLWGICEFEDGKIICFVKERWKIYDLSTYYVVQECPNSHPVWL